LPPDKTVTPEGIHAFVIGVQACGVSTPSAAAVAAATAGFESVLHIPKGGMFTVAAPSSMVPTGLPSAMTIVLLVAMKPTGVLPNAHLIVVPVVSNKPI
jgi:hypothetical protein